MKNLINIMKMTTTNKIEPNITDNSSADDVEVVLASKLAYFM